MVPWAAKYVVYDNIRWGLMQMIGPEGFDEAILGIGTVSTKEGDEEVLVYDVQKMIKIVMDDSIDMTWDEAKEFVEFNILGIYLGETGPCFLQVGVLAPGDGDTIH